MKVSCIILAGGKSSRMKRDKCFINLGGKPMISYVVEKVKKILRDVVIVVKNERQKVRLERKFKGVKVVCDKSKVFSPLAGIKEGIKHVKNDYVLIVACDMPFLSENILKELINRLEVGVDCISYFWKIKRYEPLCAIYRKKVFENVNERKSLHELIEEVRNKILIPIGKETYEFFNINNKEDLRRARKLIKYGEAGI